VGTASARRRAQLLFARGDLQMRDIRGNVDTRLAKLAQGEFDAIVLAQAGLLRLKLDARITEIFEPSVVLPAVGQGALGIEARADDRDTRALLEKLDDAAAHHAVLAERALLAALRGGCLAPVGAWARDEGGRLRLDAVVLSADGSQRLTEQAEGDLSAAAELGRGVAERLLAAGAGALIQASRNSS
jgi:hydroxymethylbilane synthase